MLGVEFVKDKKSKAIDPELCGSVMEKMKEGGVLVGKGMTFALIALLIVHVVSVFFYW